MESKLFHKMVKPAKGAKPFMVMTMTFFATPTLACDLEMTDFGADGPPDSLIEVAPDCSFRDLDYYAHDPDGYVADEVNGGPARDRGNGRIGQRIFDNLCAETERLLFVDCTTGGSLIINGAVDPATPEEEKDWYGQPELIKFIQPPYGPISIGPQSTVDSLTQIAEANGLVLFSAERIFASRGAPYQSVIDTYDYTCGCKLFYPDSVGAQ